MQEFKGERTFISKWFAADAQDIACAQTGLKSRTRCAPFHNKRVAIRDQPLLTIEIWARISILLTMDFALYNTLMNIQNRPFFKTQHKIPLALWGQAPHISNGVDIN